MQNKARNINKIGNNQIPEIVESKVNSNGDMNNHKDFVGHMSVAECEKLRVDDKVDCRYVHVVFVLLKLIYVTVFLFF